MIKKPPGTILAKTAQKPAGPQPGKTPTAPQVYRPQQLPRVLQGKIPAVNRPLQKPEPATKVLQTKATASQQQTARQPAAPPVYRPQGKKIVQQKRAEPARTNNPKAPPAYNPQPVAKVLQTKRTQTTAATQNPKNQPVPPVQSVPKRPQIVSLPRPAVQRMLKPNPVVRVAAMTAIQRLAVTGTVTETAQAHHPDYSFTIGGTTTAHDLDPWITRTAKFGHEKGITYLGKSERKKWRKKLNAVVDGWNGTKSIIHPFLSLLYGVNTENWVNWDLNPDDVPLATTDAKNALVRHMLALQENIERRVRDIPVNCYDVDLTKETRLRVVTTERVRIGWTTLLKEARLLLKAQIKRGTKCPAGPGDVTLLRDAVVATTDPGVTKLRTLTLLGDEMQLSTAPTRVVDLYTAAAAGPLSFNFGYGHVRFILFLEWRIVDDLRKIFQWT